MDRVCNIVKEVVIKTIPKKKNARRQSGWLSEEALHIAEKRREAKSKGKMYPFESSVPKNSKKR